MRRLNKAKLLTVASGAVIGSLAAWYSKSDSSLISPLDFPVTKDIKFKQKKTDLDITLFQYQSCPFCCKVRTYLDYHGMDYRIIEVNSVTQKQLKWSEYRKVPIIYVKSGTENPFQVNDSSVIISFLESHRRNSEIAVGKLKDFYREVKIIDENDRLKTDFENKYDFFVDKESGSEREDPGEKEEKEWRLWVDQKFVHVLSPNIYRTPSEALQAFRHVSQAAHWPELFGHVQATVIIYVGSFVMYFVGKMLKKRHRLRENVRESLFEHADRWIEAVGDRRFLGGDRPNLADLAMYGALLSVRGCTASDELMRFNPAISAWFHRTRKSLASHRERVAA